MSTLHRLPRHALAVATLLLACTAPVAAQMNFDPRNIVYQKGDWALLPEWCIDSQDGPYGSPEGGEFLNKSPRAREWVSKMGPDFWHMHHYCRGLRNMNRLRQAGIPPVFRTGLMRHTANEFLYVIRNCGPTMPLMPEVYLRLGELQLMMEDYGSAVQSFEASRQLRPDYWPAYERWVTVLINLKQWDQARELVNEGLRHSPGQPNLTAQLNTIQAASGRRGEPQRAAAATTADVRR